MTAKRFTFHHDVDGVDYIEDESNGVCLICDELMCSLLNELYEENQDLKSFNKDLAENLSVCANARISKDGWIEKITEENEQLKKDIEYYKIERLALFEYLDKKDDLKLELKVEK